MHYLLIYDVTAEYPSKRALYRKEHLELAWKAHERGELLLGGALSDPVDMAILLFTGSGPQAAEEFARVDPYVTNGLVSRWRVRPWTTVVGEGAASPVRPGAL
jgi:uncharacterized protein YciI